MFLLVPGDRREDPHREQFFGLLPLLRKLQRQALQFIDVILQVDRHVLIEGLVSGQCFEHAGAPASRADRARGSAAVFANRDVFVLDLAEQRRRPNIGLRLFGTCRRWIAPGLDDRAIHRI